MTGERLHEFCLDLCGYVLGHYRAELRAPRTARGSYPELDQARWRRLDAAAWMGRLVARLPAPLADHVWAGLSGGGAALPLNGPELIALALAAGDPPPSCADDVAWLSYPPLHRRSVGCVPEIRSALTRQTAEEWAAASAGYAARLGEENLSLADGVGVVHEWLAYAWQLLGAMGAAEFLPRPLGTHPTPTQPDPPSRPTSERSGAARSKPKRPKPAPSAGKAATGDAAVCDSKEAMAATGLKKTKLYELFNSGVLTGYRDGAMIRFYRAGLVAYMRERENGTIPPPRAPRKPRPAAPPAARFKYL